MRGHTCDHAASAISAAARSRVLAVPAAGKKHLAPAPAASFERATCLWNGSGSCAARVGVNKAGCGVAGAALRGQVGEWRMVWGAGVAGDFGVLALAALPPSLNSCVRQLVGGTRRAFSSAAAPAEASEGAGEQSESVQRKRPVRAAGICASVFS